MIHEKDPFSINWPGIEYLNFFTNEKINIREFNKCSVDSADCPRMPWHDIGIKLRGSVVKDLASHFI